MNNLKCPKCGGSLEIIECLETEYIDGVYIDQCFGQCKDCKTPYEWKEKFSYTESYDLKVCYYEEKEE